MYVQDELRTRARRRERRRESRRHAVMMACAVAAQNAQPSARAPIEGFELAGTHAASDCASSSGNLIAQANAVSQSISAEPAGAESHIVALLEAGRSFAAANDGSETLRIGSLYVCADAGPLPQRGDRLHMALVDVHVEPILFTARSDFKFNKLGERSVTLKPINDDASDSGSDDRLGTDSAVT